MDMTKVIIVAIGITAVLTSLVVWTWMDAAGKTGTIVIPAGNTYLGPNTPMPQNTVQPSNGGEFTTSPETPWHEIRGAKYPYVMSVPTTLALIQPAGDNPYDLYEISWGSYDPASTVLVGVDYKVDQKEAKIDYVRRWWTQFSGLKGTASIDPFTNSKGLKGYKAKYINSAGETPNLDVFFEVPEHPELIIHLANGILNPAVFDKIVDSVRWSP